MNRNSYSRENTENKSGKSRRRLALALLLALLTGAFLFFTSDSPGIVKYRELLLGELSVSDSGEEPADTHETSDTETAEKGSAQTADSCFDLQCCPFRRHAEVCVSAASDQRH